MLRTNGLYVIVDLHWNAPGTNLAARSSRCPTPTTPSTSGSRWRGVQERPGVVFDLYNEPYPDKGTSDPWGCWLNGCMLSDWTGFTGTAPRSVCSSSSRDVRGAGAQNVVMVGRVGLRRTT